MATPITWKGSTISDPILVGDISNIPTIITTSARGKQTTRSFTIIDYRDGDVPDEIDITPQQFLTWRGITREGVLGGNSVGTPSVTNEVDNNPNVNYIEPYKFIVEKAVLGVSQEQWNKIQSLQQQTIYFIGRPATVVAQPTIFGTLFTTGVVINTPTQTTETEVCALQPQINTLSRDSENPVQARLKGVFREQQLSTELQNGELKVKFQFPNGTVKYADILSFTDSTVEQCQAVLNEVRRDAESTLAEEIRTRGEIIRQNEIAVRDLEDRLRETGIQFGLDLEGARREFDASLDSLTRQNASLLADKQKEFDAQINARNTTISSLENTIRQQINQIGSLGARINTITSQLSASEIARQGLTNQLSTAEAARRALAGQLTESQTATSALTNQLSTAEAARRALAGQLTESQTARSVLTNQLTATETARRTLASQLSTSETARQNLSNQLAASVSDRQNLNNQIRSLETLRGSLEENLASATAANLGLTGQISGLRDEANLLSQRNANLAAQAAISQQTINSLNANLNSERQKLNNVKNTIEKSLENGSGQYVGLIQQNLGTLSGLLGINFSEFEKDAVAITGATAATAAVGRGIVIRR